MSRGPFIVEGADLALKRGRRPAWPAASFLSDDRPDLRRTRQYAEPLFFVQRDRKTAHAVQRDATLVLCS